MDWPDNWDQLEAEYNKNYDPYDNNYYPEDEGEEEDE
jgi:hypothetical protein